MKEMNAEYSDRFQDAPNAPKRVGIKSSQIEMLLWKTMYPVVFGWALFGLVALMLLARDTLDRILVASGGILFAWGMYNVDANFRKALMRQVVSGACKDVSVASGHSQK